MDATLLLLGVLFFLLFPIAALHWLFSGRPRLKRLQEHLKLLDSGRWRDEINRLERRIRELEAQIERKRDSSAVPEVPAAPPSETGAPEPAAPADMPRPAQVKAKPSPPPEPAAAAAAPAPAQAKATPSPPPEPAADRPRTPEPESAEAWSLKSGAWPAFARVEETLTEFRRLLTRPTEDVGSNDRAEATKAPGAAAERRGAADWESRIGRSWLNVIGVVVLVVGVILLIGYSLRYLGPPGRVGIGFATGSVLLLGGWWLEKLERYRGFSLAPIGGGWALAYFTAYAAHNVDAARIIDNPFWALPLMVAVAAGMIWHSFRYRSQLVTGLAYGLAYFAVVLSPITGFSLFASSLLGVSLVAVLRAVPWYHLGAAGVAGTYLCFFLWLEGSAGQSGLAATTAFNTSIAVLAFYWAVFSVAAFIRKPSTQTEGLALFVLSAANSVGFFSLAVWLVRTVHPSDLYVLTLLGGVAYVVLSYLLRVAGLRSTFLLNALIAVALFALTPPLALKNFELNRDWLALPWLVEAAAVIAFGFRLKEILLRLAGYLLCASVLTALLAFNLRLAPEDSQLVLWLTVPPVIAFFFYLFEKLQLVAGKEDVRPAARPLALVFGYAATALLATFLWLEITREFLAVGWLIAGVAFVEVGLRFARPHVRIQGYLLCGLALAGALIINLLEPGFIPTGARLPAWVTVGVCISIFYLLYARLYGPLRAGLLWPEESVPIDGASYAGALLLAVLLAHELESDRVGLAWVFAGVVSLEAGMRWSGLHLRYQAYGFAALSVGALLLVNLYGLIPMPEGVFPRTVSTVSIAVLIFYYLFARLTLIRRRGEALTPPEVAWAPLPSYAATALLAVLCWVELNSVAVAVAWVILALALYEIGGWLKQPALRLQAHAMAGLSFGRLFLANFVAFGDILGVSHRVLSVLPVTAVFYYLRSAVAQDATAAGASILCRRMPPLYSYGAAILLVVLARFEFGRGGAIMAWAPLAVLLLVVGTELKDRDFRIQSYLISMVTFVRSWATNLSLVGSFYGIPERIATTSIAIVAFLAATLFCLKRRDAFAGFAAKTSPFEWIDGKARWLFSFLATVLLAVLLAYEVHQDWLTVAWALEAFAVLALGFLLVERSFRIYGLALLLICLLKLVFLDMQGAETIYRIISFIVVGIILLLISFGYTRYQDLIKRYL